MEHRPWTEVEKAVLERAIRALADRLKWHEERGYGQQKKWTVETVYVDAMLTLRTMRNEGNS